MPGASSFYWRGRMGGLNPIHTLMLNGIAAKDTLVQQMRIRGGAIDRGDDCQCVKGDERCCDRGVAAEHFPPTCAVAAYVTGASQRVYTRGAVYTGASGSQTP